MNAAAQLASANTDTLVHMCILHAEGTPAGDAAWIALQLRAGFRGALALIETEKAARDLDIWTQRMEAAAAIAMAA